jgi:hypothetical protein
MDFAKFVALLEQRAVYFCRADLLGDRFEGAAGIRERWPKWEAFYLDFFRKAVATVPDQLKPPPPEQIEQEAARLFADFNTISDRDRRRTFASCWHSNTVESEALWRLYCPPPTAGVAIRTDVEALGISLGEDPQIRIGQVQYVDFRKGFAGLHDRIFWKRKSLSHEAEVRAVIQKFDPQQEPGLRVLADLPRLLHAVVPSPFAPTWFAEIVEATMQRFDVSAPIVRSELLSEPFF